MQTASKWYGPLIPQGNFFLLFTLLTLIAPCLNKIQEISHQGVDLTNTNKFYALVVFLCTGCAICILCITPFSYTNLPNSYAIH